MKIKEKESAKQLREQGLSLKEICNKLGVTKSSVSLWTRGIKLTEEQLTALKIRTNSPCNATKGQILLKEKYLANRKEYQREGKNLIKDCDKEFIAGIMLYWAEGRKCRNYVSFSNGDARLLKFFVDFLRKYFKVPNDKMSFSFQWYSGNYLKYEEVEKFWLNLLNLDETNLKKCFVDYRPTKNLGQKKNKLPYGVGRITVYDTSIVQRIYGAIQGFIGFIDETWVL